MLMCGCLCGCVCVCVCVCVCGCIFVNHEVIPLYNKYCNGYNVCLVVRSNGKRTSGTISYICKKENAIAENKNNNRWQA